MRLRIGICLVAGLGWGSGLGLGPGVAVALAAAPAFAQESAAAVTAVSAASDRAVPGQAAGAKTPAVRPRVRKPPLGGRAYLIFESTSLASSNTLNAVVGSSTFVGVGGGGELLNFWRTTFVRFAVSKASRSGTRALIVGGQLIPTGVPIDVGIRNVELSVGWRRSPRKHPRLAFYGGAGLVFSNLCEKSAFAQTGDDTSETTRGYLGFAGLDAPVWKRIVAGVEGQYRAVPNAIGEGGLSKAYGESSLSGLAIRATMGVRLTK